MPDPRDTRIARLERLLAFAWFAMGLWGTLVTCGLLAALILGWTDAR